MNCKSCNNAIQSEEQQECHCFDHYGQYCKNCCLKCQCCGKRHIAGSGFGCLKKCYFCKTRVCNNEESCSSSCMVCEIRMCHSCGLAYECHCCGKMVCTKCCPRDKTERYKIHYSDFENEWFMVGCDECGGNFEDFFDLCEADDFESARKCLVKDDWFIFGHDFNKPIEKYCVLVYEYMMERLYNIEVNLNLETIEMENESLDEFIRLCKDKRFEEARRIPIKEEWLSVDLESLDFNEVPEVFECYSKVYKYMTELMTYLAQID